ncbi:hypothetical protein Kpho02_72830 [Kitasatospora phosalacinea]|uniref:Uncharacterized protein n=1 Tax=Kitasatospora phosalacinea TaxID=2065 RepID=A0A9W6V4R1_9ACTN|nr:hypothetical protein [Kitasatospora phosalacinea]GLW74986.1 hypothetical protein Kpho02_72830 [Kitasatospora phosalacinea]
MPLLTATRPTRSTGFDTDAAGLLLVAEVEHYLRSLTPPGRTTVATTAPTARPGGALDLTQLLQAAAPTVAPVAAAGSVLQPWHHPYPLPAPTLTDRLLGRRPVADTTVEEHLDLVAAYIHRHGWTQGQLWAADGAVCILGAQLHVLAHGFGTPYTATRARQRLGNALGRLGHPVPVDRWNDQPGRRASDVHHLLRTAAAHS